MGSKKSWFIILIGMKKEWERGVVRNSGMSGQTDDWRPKGLPKELGLVPRAVKTHRKV